MKCVAVIVSLLPCCLGFRPSFRPFRTKLFDKVGGRVTPVLMMTKEDASMDLNDNPTALIRGPTTSKVKMWTKPLLKVFHSVDKLGFSGTLLSWELWVGGLLLLAPFMEFSVPFLNPPHHLFDSLCLDSGLMTLWNNVAASCFCMLAWTYLSIRVYGAFVWNVVWFNVANMFYVLAWTTVFYKWRLDNQ